MNSLVIKISTYLFPYGDYVAMRGSNIILQNKSIDQPCHQ